MPSKPIHLNKSLKDILSIAAGHLTHDFFTAFLAALLPKIIDVLSINLTSAGILTSISQIPSILNPMIGYLADKRGAKYFVIFAPAFTATFMSLIGMAPSFSALALLLFLSGISSTIFHASSPGLVASAADHGKGFGLSLYMAGGGIGRSLGPIAAIWAVSMWGLSGMYRLMFIGWGVSIFLAVQFRQISLTIKPRGSLRNDFPYFRRFFIPLALVLILRSALIASLTTYLPVYMVDSGAPLWLAGASLSILEFSGVTGALVLGPISDKIGRTRILNLSMFISSILIPVFLLLDDWAIFPVLVVLGFFSVSTGTIFMALVQDNFQHHPATGNSIYILLSFLTNALMLVAIGSLGDQFGLRAAYMISSAAALISIPAMRLLPNQNTSQRSG